MLITSQPDFAIHGSISLFNDFAEGTLPVEVETFKALTVGNNRTR